MSSSSNKNTISYSPNNHLQDFWKTLWHVDVQKDHGNDYDAKIVNSFLYEDIYKTTQSTQTGKYISFMGQTANKTIEGASITFSDLFSYLTNGIEYATVTSYPIGTRSTIQLNPNIMGEQANYNIHVYDANGEGLASTIVNDICLYVDTASHLPELIAKYRAESGDKPLYYAYTREIENDPADKITFKTIGDQNKSAFYYELPAPENPTIVPYPTFDKTNGLSYFYCKYPLFLRYNGLKDSKKYQLKTELSYIKDGKTILVQEGANIAGAIQKFTTGIKSLVGLKTDSISKEIVFISKHHGDVAQSLLQFRDVKLKCPLNDQIITTADYKGAFVSIDVNAIIKALTIGMPYIIMYPPDKKRIIVWKNQNLDDVEMVFEYEKNQTIQRNKSLQKSIQSHNNEIDRINTQKQQFDEIFENKMELEEFDPDTVSENEIQNKYVDLIKFGIRACILSQYLPSNKLEEIVEADFENQIQIILDLDKDLSDKITDLKKIQTEISEIESTLQIPTEYLNLKVVHDSKLIETSLEKDVLFDFTTSIALAFKSQGTKLKHLWESIDLSYIIGDRTSSSRICRVSTKLNSSWGIDLIKYIYSHLENYNIEFQTQFIKTLFEIVPTAKKPTFKFGINLHNINVDESEPLTGGMKGLTTPQRPKAPGLSSEEKVEQPAPESPPITQTQQIVEESPSQRALSETEAEDLSSPPSKINREYSQTTPPRRKRQLSESLRKPIALNTKPPNEMSMAKLFDNSEIMSPSKKSIITPTRKKLKPSSPSNSPKSIKIAKKAKTQKKSIKPPKYKTFKSIKKEFKSFTRKAQKEKDKNEILNLHMKGLDIEITDMISHCKFILEVINKHDIKKSAMTFFSNTFGKKTTTLNKTIKNNTIKINSKKSLKNTGKDSSSFDHGAKFLSTYNVFPLYDDFIDDDNIILKQIENIIKRTPSKRYQFTTIKRKLNELSELIYKIKKENP